MKPTRILAALSASIVLTTPLKASDSADRSAPPSRSLLYKTLDTDDDGTLSTGEIDGSTTALRTLDADSDGTLSRKELLPPKPAADQESTTEPEDAPANSNAANGDEQETRPHPPHPRPSPLMIVLDLDHDGALSSEELEEAPRSLKVLDTNGDGEVNLDDMRLPPPPEVAPSGGRPQGPPPRGHRPHPAEEDTQEPAQEPVTDSP